MDEKNKYSIDDILEETEHRKRAHSPKDISAKADKQADIIFNELRRKNQLDTAQEDFDAFFASLQQRSKKRENQHAQQREELPAVDEPKSTEVKVVPVKPVLTQTQITLAPEQSDVPQSKKRMRSVDEILAEIERTHRAEEIGADTEPPQPQAQEQKKHKHLTNTGVIRKANQLIGIDEEDGISESSRMDTVGRMGIPRAKEKIVGEKDDIQTKAYHAYVRQREKKKQDTGIVKTSEVKLREDMPSDKTRKIEQPLREEGFTVSKEEAQGRTIHAPGKATGAREEAGGSDFLKPALFGTEDKPMHGQLTLEGCEKNEEPGISEEELEETLGNNRRKKIDGFELDDAFKNKNKEAVNASEGSRLEDTYAPEKETPIIHDVIDYNSKAEQRSVFLELQQLLGRFKIRSYINIVLFAVAAVIGLLGTGIISDFGPGTGNEKVYIIINCVLCVLLILANGRAVLKGIKSLFMLKPSGDSLMSFASLVTLAHGFVCFFFGEEGSGTAHMYAPALAVIFLLNSLGKQSMLRRIFCNFRFLIKKGSKFSAARMTEQKEITELLQSRRIEDADIRYNVQTEFATRFLAHSYADDPADTLAKHTAYAVIGASVVIGVITYFITKDVISAVSALTILMLTGIPASALLSFNRSLETADKELLKERGMVTGFAAVKDAAQTTAVVLDSADLCPPGYCQLKGMKLFKSMQMDNAILYAAGVLQTTNHPFRDVFLESASEVKNKIPPAIDTAIEARLGISSWVYSQKVLLGNTQMMRAHGIEIPAKANPDEFNKRNERVMFLAIDGKVYAMFVLSYFSDPAVEYEMQRLEEEQIQLLVKTEDPNIDEKLLAEIFDLDPENIKILGTGAGLLYEEKRSQPVYNEAKLVNRGDTMTFIRSINACTALKTQLAVLKTAHYLSMAFALLIAAIFALTGSVSLLNPLYLVIYILLWCGVTAIIPIFKKR